MLSNYTNKYDLYRSYAYKVCRCHDLKNDLVNDMYLKLHDKLKEDSTKIFSDRYIYRTILNIFLDMRKKKGEILLEDLPDIPEEETNLNERMAINDVLNEMRFFDREILLKTQESSLREIGRKIGCHHTTVGKIRNEAMEKLKQEYNG